jgi:hypothetical protein
MFINFNNIMSNILSKSKKTILLFLFVNFIVLAKAQYPVQIIPQLVSPYTLNLSDYYTGTTPKLYVTLTNRDMQRPVAYVRLRMSITGQLASIFTTEYGNYPTISLDAGVPQRLSMSDLAPYFNPNNLDFTGSMTKQQYLQQNKLPEGFYSFCFQAVEINTNKIVSENTCSNIWISLSDPPLLNTPANASAISKSDPINILFNWTPRHLNSPNGAFNTDYEFQIKEIWDNNIDPQAAFQTAIPLFTTTTQTTTLLYGPTQPVLIAGKRYAWRVRAKARNLADDRDDFKNNGFSDVFWFDYKTVCPVPSGYSINKIDPTTVTIGWINGLNITDYVVEYRQVSPSLSAWVKTPLINTNPLPLNNLVPSSNYEIKVASNCPGNILEYGKIQVFSTQQVLSNTSLSNNVVKIKGRTTWSYYNKGEISSTENNTLVLKATVGSNKNCSVTKDITNAKKFALPSARVVVVRILNGLSREELGSGFTDAFGNFSINIPIDKASTKGIGYSAPNVSYNIEVTPARNFSSNASVSIKTNLTNTGSIFNVKKTISIDPSPNYEITSIVKNFEYEPKITSNDIATAQQSSMSVDILLSKSDWDNTYSKLPINIGKSLKGNTIYNNQTYVILDNLTTGNLNKQLMQGFNYVAKINCQNGIPTYSVINSVTDYCKLSECYDYPFFSGLSGVVKSGGTARNNATITLTLKDNDRIGNTSNTSKTTTLTVRTNANGEYDFDSIPKLKPNSSVNITVNDATVRRDAFVFNKLMSSSTNNTFDINLVNEVHTYMGRLVDQNNLPIVNALIEVDGNVLTNKTGNDGFFLFQTNYSSTKTINFSGNGYTSKSITLQQFQPSNAGSNFYNLANTNNLEDSWCLNVRNAAPIANFIQTSAPSFDKQTGVNSQFFGYQPGILNNLFYKIASNPSEKIMGIYSISKVEMTNQNENITLEIKLKGNIVASKISFISVNGVNENSHSAYTTIAGKKFMFSASAGSYKFNVVPISDNEPFVPFAGEFSLKNTTSTIMLANQSITINLTDGVILKGTVYNIIDNSILDSAAITSDGLPYKDSSNKQGEYRMYLPRNESIKLHVARKGFNSFDSTVKLTNNVNTINFNLLPFDKSFAPVHTIAGFKVEVDKQLSAGQPNTYVVSGKLILDNNDVFNTVKDYEKLTFRNISVVVDPSTNDALPVVDILFEEAIIQSKAFGYAVEIVGLPQIKLSSLRTAAKGNYSPAVIGGSQIVTKLASSGSTFKFRDAILRDDDVVQNNNAFNYVYITPKTKINALSDAKTYKVEFIEDKFDYTKTIYLKKDKNAAIQDSNFLEVSIIPKVSLFIDKFNSSLSKDGLSMKGYFQVPKQLTSKIDSNGKIQLDKFTLDKNFKVAEITFAIGKQKPLFMQLQKITIKLTSVSLYGLGTPNMGVGFGGEVWLKQKPRTSTDQNDVLTINKLELVNKSEGLTFSGSFSLPTNGITVKNLVFKNSPSSPAALEMSYNFTEQSFKLSASGILDYNGTNNNKIIKSVFPIGIQSFMLDTKTWGVFMKANADIKLDFKVMQINVTDFLVNVGYSMSLNDMNNFLVNKKVTQASNGGADEAIDETKTSWAIGISGGIEFPIKQIKVAIKGTVLFGNINNQIQAAVNEIELNIDNAPAFTLYAKVAMTFNDTKQGFEAAGKFNTLSKGFDASFKYYSFNSGGFELGAKIIANLGTTGVTTGPVNWFSIGGGFDFNTSAKTYAVFFSGEVSTAGTPKTAAYLKIARIGLLFDLGKCPGGQPVFDGSAELFIKNESWGQLTTKFDFCRMTMLITVNGAVPLVTGLAKIPVYGIVYGLAPQGGKDGAFFMSVNASLSGLFNSYVNGNAFIALGINYDNNHPLAPQEIKNIWNSIDNGAKDGLQTSYVDNWVTIYGKRYNIPMLVTSATKLNAIYVSANMTVPSRSGSFGVKISSFDLFNVSYSVNASGSFKLYYKFSNNNLWANAKVNANASGSMTILGFSLYGSAYVNGTVNGGYNGSWYLNGDLSMGFQVYNRASASCNGISYPWECHRTLPYPCGSLFWPSTCWVEACGYNIFKPSFKACFDAKLAFSFRQGQTPSISLRF